uniref:Homeobox domain-containing protein n=1 Tax=Heliothis virescens TaxID=7102 RepID=A0A2A4IXJ9_HELVI
MIQNLLLTSFTPLKNKNEINCWENRPFTTVWPENSFERKRDITRTIKKKQKRVRTAFSTEQLRALERAYSRHKYIDSEKRAELANTLNIGDKCIKIWFQNRRMKEKRESSESSCDSSSESVSNEPNIPASPPLEITPEIPSNKHFQKYSPYPNHGYELPTYYNTNQIPSGYGAMPPNYGTYFYNDNNAYPTQYYPFDVNYSNEGNGYSQCGSEMNNCWASHHQYYSNI